MTALLAAALVEAQKAMPKVDKTGTSNFGKHVTLDHLIAQTRQHLAKNDLAILQFPATSELGAPLLRTVLMHVSGESLQADTPLLLDGKQTMQALGGAITYARRYGWSSVLGISTEDDDDGDAVSAPAKAGGVTNPHPSPKPAAPKPADAAPAAAQQKTQGDTTEADAALLKIVAEKDGNVAAVTNALAAAKAEGKYEDYYAKCLDFWEKKFVAPKAVNVPAGKAA